MATKIILRVASTIPIMFTVSVVLFFIMTILPGDAAASFYTSETSAEYIEQLRERLGLNRPAYIRYLYWVGGMMQGDFGNSLITGLPVSNKIMQRFPATVELAILSMAVSVLIAIPTGIISATRRNSLWDTIASFISMVGLAIPHFWLGMLLILLFSLKLQWIPASGYVPFFENPGKNLTLMLMPAITIGSAFAATIMRQTRSALLDVLDQDYILTAKAKGLPGWVLIWKHALRNSLIPVITVISMYLGRLFGGAVVTETVFAMPGLGREIVDSIMSRDTPVTMGVIIVVALIVVLINTLMDVVYVIVDPRVSHSRTG